MRIGVILAVHNRRQQTLTALAAVSSLEKPADCQLEIFLLDDASPDGTAQAVKEQFPGVHLLRGTGSLYWNGGMRQSFAEGLMHNCDFYLWLNDDTVLHSSALLRLLQTSRALDSRAIVVGTTSDPGGSAATYGGLVSASRLHPFRYRLLKAADQPVKVDAMNGNCVLIPALVARSVGNLDPAFRHGIGDFDYALRARRQGFEIWLAPGFIGYCSRGEPRGTWQDATLPLVVRWGKFLHVKGLPAAEWAAYTRRHGGWLWPVYWASPYCKLVVQHALNRGSRWLRDRFGKNGHAIG